MHFSKPTIAAACSLYLTLSSAEVIDVIDLPVPAIGETVNHLDSNGMLHWTPAPNGGRTTTVSREVVDQALLELEVGSSQKLKARKAPKAHVGHFHDMGQIAGYDAWYACEKDGSYGVSSSIDDYIEIACDGLLRQVPYFPIAEDAWKIYQTPVLQGANGNAISVYFRYFTNTASAPELTWDICTTVFVDLTTMVCQGKNDHSKETRGGEIKIGAGDDYLMVGFDPNHV